MENSGLLLISLAFLYFVPTVVAYTRRHRNENPIFLTNLFLGWTFLGWVVALIWGNTDYCRPKPEPTTQQLDQEIRKAERLNWLLNGFFGVVALLVGLGMGGVGIRFIVSALRASKNVQDPSLLVGATALALGTMVIWGVIAPTIRGTFLFVCARAVATLMGIALSALGERGLCMPMAQPPLKPKSWYELSRVLWTPG